MPGVSPLLTLQAIACGYKGHQVVRNLSFDVLKGEMISLLGSSGCGKTTALRAIAGFTPLQAGTITLGGQVISRAGFTLPPEKRRVGMVFQDYALFPHLTVEANVAYGLQGRAREEKRAITRDMLHLVGLAGLKGRYPHELSGGQQQRTALARALAPHPELILLDEPFSNLDVDLRERLSMEVRQILESQGMTGILVTHDQHEAFAWGDKVGVLQAGGLCQWGTPYEIYHQPKDCFVAGFIGQGTFLSGVYVPPDGIMTGAGLLVGCQTWAGQEGDRVQVLIRPDDVVPDDASPITARVVRRAFKGAEILYTLQLDSGCQIQSLFPSHRNHQVGESLRIRVAMEHLVAFPESTPCTLSGS
ncbi:MAG: ABC transporter ATP-binding protein [Magnetococcales bacterium]|nr:ABC transporter ATP-binding protein [Magnetococcales bacterium]